MASEIAPGLTALPMTAEQLCGMHEDEIERELVRGELRAFPHRLHIPAHAKANATLSAMLSNWHEEHVAGRGEVVAGAAFCVQRNPDSLVGIDVAYVSPELAARTADRVAFFDGPPVLAVEILAPWDEHGTVVERVNLYLEVGVVVWLVDPYFKILTVYRPGRYPEGLSTSKELSGEPELPGFRIRVAEIFDR